MTDAQTTDATSTDTTTVTDFSAATTQTKTEPELGDGGKAALEAERKARKEAEKAHKAATAELEKLRQATATDQEKAVMAAKAEGRTEALREAGQGRVEDAVRAAAGGRQVDVDALLDGLDRTKFLDDDGQPDRDAIQAWIDRIAPAEQERGDGFQTPDLGQGTRTQAMALNGDPLERALKDALHIR